MADGNGQCSIKVGDLCVHPNLVQDASASRWAEVVGSTRVSQYPSEAQARKECESMKVGLMPHQESVVRWSASVLADWQQTKFLKHRGLLTFHNVGAGKTREMVGIMVCARKLMPDAMVVFVATKKQIEQLFSGDLANDYRAMPPAMLADAGLPSELREEDVVLAGSTKQFHLPRYDHNTRSVTHLVGRSKDCACLDPRRFGAIDSSGQTPAIVGIPIEEFSRHILRKEEVQVGARVNRSWTHPIDFSATNVIFLFDEAHNLQKPPPAINSKDKNLNVAELYKLMQEYFQRASVEARSFLVLLTSTPANSFEDFMGMSKLLLYRADHSKIDSLAIKYKQNGGLLSQDILEQWSSLMKGKIHAFQALNLFTYPRLQFMMARKTYKDGSESPMDTVNGIRQLAETGPEFDDVTLIKELMKLPKVRSDPARRRYLGSFNPLYDFSGSIRNKNGAIIKGQQFGTTLRGKQFLGPKGTFGKQLEMSTCTKQLASFSPKLARLCEDMRSTRGEKHLIACNKIKRYDLSIAVSTVLQRCLGMERFDMARIAPRPKTIAEVRIKTKRFLDSQVGKKRFFYLHNYTSSVSVKQKRWYWEVIRSASSKNPGVFNLARNRDGSILEAIVLSELPDYEGVSLKYLQNIHIMDTFPMDSFGQIIGRGQRPCSFGPDTPTGKIKIKIYATSWPEVERLQMFSEFTRRIANKIHLTDGSKPWVQNLKRKLTRISHGKDANKAYEAKSALRLLHTFLQKDGDESFFQSVYVRFQKKQAERSPKMPRAKQFEAFWKEVEHMASSPKSVSKTDARKFFEDKTGSVPKEAVMQGPADFGVLLSAYYDYKKVLQMYLQTMSASINCKEFKQVHDRYGAMPAGALVKGLQCHEPLERSDGSGPPRDVTQAVLIDIDETMKVSPFTSVMGLFANRLRSIAKLLKPTDMLEKAEIMEALRKEYGGAAAPAAYETFVEIVDDIL